jgi:2-(1,2-epoxy-1,2-dihydrophenyl)acetyl-CoA isomerase
MSGAADVLHDQVGAVAVISLNRPDRLNAMNLSLMERLRAALSTAAHDTSTRCVVVRGSGRSFCAGGDAVVTAGRRERASASSPGAALTEAEQMLRRHAESIEIIVEMPKPVLAALRGDVVGGGLALALAADLRLVSETLKLRVGYLRAGLSGDFGISYLLPDLVGGGVARRLSLLDEVVDATRALELGLATEVVRDDELDDRTMELASELASGPTLAIARLKENFIFARRNGLSEAIRNEALGQRLISLTEDAAEAITAFRERRQPNFHGR